MIYTMVIQDSDLEVVETIVSGSIDLLKDYLRNPDNGVWFEYDEGFDIESRLDQLDGVGPTIDFDGFYVTIQKTNILS